MADQPTTIPITSLTPHTPLPPTTSIRATITLSWPYSSTTHQCALLLSDPDARLRSRGAQVRVRFSGPAAQAVAEARVGIGDVVVLGLDGGRWEIDGTRERTPGRGVEGGLWFRGKLVMRVEGRDDGGEVRVDEVEEGEEGEKRRDGVVETPMRKDVPGLRERVGEEGEGQIWVGTMAGDGPFEREVERWEAEQGGQRRSFGAVRQWRYAEKSPSPVKEAFENGAAVATGPVDGDLQATMGSEDREMLPPPLPRLQVPDAEGEAPQATMPEQQLEQQHGRPTTPKLQPVKSPTLPLPSPFPTDTPKRHFGGAEPTTFPTSPMKRHSPSRSDEAGPPAGTHQSADADVHSDPDDDADDDNKVPMQEAEPVELLSDTEPDTDHEKMLDDGQTIPTTDATDVHNTDEDEMLELDTTMESDLLTAPVEAPKEVLEEILLVRDEPAEEQSTIPTEPQTPERPPQAHQRPSMFGFDGTSSVQSSTHVTPLSEKDRVMLKTYRSLFGFKASPEAEEAKAAAEVEAVGEGDVMEEPSVEETPVQESESPSPTTASVQPTKSHGDVAGIEPPPPMAQEVEVVEPTLGEPLEHVPEPDPQDVAGLDADGPVSSEPAEYIHELSGADDESPTDEESPTPMEVMESSRPPPTAGFSELARARLEASEAPLETMQDVAMEPASGDAAVEASRRAERSSPGVDEDEPTKAAQPRGAEVIELSSSSEDDSEDESEEEQFDDPTIAPQGEVEQQEPVLETIRDPGLADEITGDDAGDLEPHVPLRETQDADPSNDVDMEETSSSDFERSAEVSHEPLTIDPALQDGHLSQAPNDALTSTGIIDGFEEHSHKPRNLSAGLVAEVDLLSHERVSDDEEAAAEAVQHPKFFPHPDESQLSQSHVPSGDEQEDPSRPQPLHQAPAYPSLPLSPLNSQPLQDPPSQLLVRDIVETARSALPPTPELTQIPPDMVTDNVVVEEEEGRAPTPQQAQEDIISDPHPEEEVTTPMPEKKTPARKSRRSRLSNIPDVISAWFSPKRSSAAEAVNGERDRHAEGQQQQKPVATQTISEPSTAKPVHVNGVSTALSYFTPLSRLDECLNPSSQQSHGNGTVDIFAVVTDKTKEPARAKGGPRDYYTIFRISDTSITSSTSVRAEIFRPWKATLPVAEVGDVILLRDFAVKSRNRQAYLLSTDASAWCVWRYQDASVAESNAKKPAWARKSTEQNGTTVREEVKGPPVELGDEERKHATSLRSWWEGNVHARVEEKADEQESVGVGLNGHAPGPVATKL
ncbi:uncharacterized protein LTR77_011089 [Saxophila tyrrhenica]|uniref:Telomeric single stranded DNA binding POT1/Cdc13 domain-containing protein n=1 Tax=Saxophila tyrrhenica TaxID=1690608 RepID=A0AAV9NVB7_9PEZI|nr:hypothetical protein LTR77_011089 [Saxophila tyrrhenica]